MSPSQVLRSLEMPSRKLGRPMKVSVWLPPDHDPEAMRYPVLWLLHGRGGMENDWLDAGRVDMVLNRLSSERAIPPLVVVMPAGEDSWYVDNADPGGRGPWASAFLEELVPWAEARFGGLARRSGRVVAGLSMGGYGALRFALRHPDRFAGVASLSGALFPREAFRKMDTSRFEGAFGDPFQLERYLRDDPLANLKRLAKAKHVPAIWLACGDDDGIEFEQYAAQAHAKLRAAGIASELRIDQGGHDWDYWPRALDPALRFLASVLDRPESPATA